MASVATEGERKAARVLLVDDEHSVQTLLAYPLRNDGYEVVSAVDGRQVSAISPRGSPKSSVPPRGAIGRRSIFRPPPGSRAADSEGRSDHAYPD